MKPDQDIIEQFAVLAKIELSDEQRAQMKAQLESKMEAQPRAEEQLRPLVTPVSRRMQRPRMWMTGAAAAAALALVAAGVYRISLPGHGATSSGAAASGSTTSTFSSAASAAASSGSQASSSSQASSAASAPAAGTAGGSGQNTHGPEAFSPQASSGQKPAIGTQNGPAQMADSTNQSASPVTLVQLSYTAQDLDQIRKLSQLNGVPNTYVATKSVQGDALQAVSGKFSGTNTAGTPAIASTENAFFSMQFQRMEIDESSVPLPAGGVVSHETTVTLSNNTKAEWLKVQNKDNSSDSVLMFQLNNTYISIKSNLSLQQVQNIAQSMVALNNYP